MKNKGFTFVEILIVVVLVGVLVALTVPKFLEGVEKSKANQAAAYLRMIKAGQQMYYSKNDFFLVSNDPKVIKTHLAVDITGTPYNFAIESETPDDFTATATRQGTTDTIIIDEEGEFNGTSRYKPAS
ncbi:MAG: Type II secretion system protein G precursor [Candidatus Omnitrophica bacterium ADurb.Bin277]|nr:MAG: Type II secretion system protein G precursor [Candidatus Omnitrophica bacterium ADurb.Bin277]